RLRSKETSHFTHTLSLRVRTRLPYFPPQKAYLCGSVILNHSRSSLMASSSSSSSRTWRYRVFTSFHGPDVRKTFLSHLRKQFIYNGITMFDDQGIERSQIIAPALTQGIRESRIAIVVLSKNYASSSWCLDELLEILDCKEELGQIVMTVFYGVDPSDVRKQTGDFGIAFDKTCAKKTEEDRRKWSQALTFVGNIAGEHFRN
ncbi:unnamed protein product, partial [Arabidopsis halleri]